MNQAAGARCNRSGYDYQEPHGYYPQEQQRPAMTGNTGSTQSVQYPFPLKLHKKTVQVEISLKMPGEKNNGRKKEQTQGAVFFSMARALNPDGSKMDWENQVTMKLGLSDIARIVTAIRTNNLPADIVHNNKQNRITSLKIEPGSPGTYKFMLNKKEGNTNDTRFTFLNMEDIYLMLTLLDASVPRIMAWN
jgi:hypothetical protein